MPIINRRTLIKSAAAGAALAALPRTAFAQTQRPRIVIAVPTQPDYADPVMLNNTPALRMLYNAYDALLRMDYNDNLALYPALAESWERIDAATVEFKLRPRVKFHDGSLMTSDDVVFSLSDERKLGPNGAGRTIAGQYQNNIAKVEAVDPLTVRVTTRIPDPATEKKLAAWSAQIVSRAAFNEAGSWDNWFAAPIGAGAYRIASNKKDVGLALESHDEYWGGLPPFARIEFRVVPESASRVNGLLAGDYDIISDVLPDQFGGIEPSSDLELVGGSISNLRVIIIDTTAPILSDARIRKSMSLAIDRQQIIDQLWAGRTTIPNGAQYAIFGDVYDASRPAPAYDPEQAKTLIAEAGYGGEPITYKLINNWYPNQALTAQVLVSMWKAVGLNVVLQPVENSGQIEITPPGCIYDNSLLPAWPDPTSMVWRQYGPGGGTYKLGVWKSEEYQSIGNAFRQSSDAAERKILQHRSLELIAEDVPFIILHNNGAFYAKRKNLAWAPYSALVMDFGPFNPAMRG
ncbi:ABC transporter substrate-binding protein [Mesorhizobium delmotii]|uniref:Oligopeptide ABC transpoter oligopeptide-binding protein n=1 Tax=Mesorhizobium delmotii TaxID=1631247 RepID=A0A2P9AMX5_9HYPH|nr:ABC transporter substrate-binding protein [Mesorhizobium delmotii]SJM32506.1 Oligopeptide ABC transpoter oligopeptide-binding protein [Mesorhizobium delmotii]